MTGIERLEALRVRLTPAQPGSFGTIATSVDALLGLSVQAQLTSAGTVRVAAFDPALQLFSVVGSRGNDIVSIPTTSTLTFTFDGLDGTDTATGGAGDDRVNGQDGANTLNGLGGSDDIGGNGGTDTPNGGAGDDKLFGCNALESAADTINGDEGNDQITVGTSETASGGAGNDALRLVQTAPAAITGGIGTDSFPCYISAACSVLARRP